MSGTAVPAVAAAASWMESLRLPLREIQRQYTKSEMHIMAWRSSEISYNMSVSALTNVVNHQTSRMHPVMPEETSRNGVMEQVSDPYFRQIEERLGPVAIKMVDEVTGEIKLSKLTGDEAMRYMGALGIPIGGRV